jgi:uncharacterized protein (TIGR02231 family)
MKGRMRLLFSACSLRLSLKPMLRLTLIGLAFVGLNPSLYSQPAPLVSKVERVKVYLQGAEVYRSVRSEIPKGISEMVIGHLSTGINPASIQVASSNNVAVLSATYRTNFLRPREWTGLIKTWQDSVEVLKVEIYRLETRKNVLEKESELFLNNRQIGGQQVGVTAAELQKVADLFRLRMNQIREEHFDLVRKMSAMQEAQQRLQRQIQEYSGGQGQQSGEIVLQLASENSVSSTIEFTYLVNDAGWSALYDLRAENVAQPVQIVSKAQVYQRSGEAWNQVPLILSTGTPISNSNLPVLQKNSGFSFRGARSDAGAGYADGIQMKRIAPVAASSVEVREDMDAISSDDAESAMRKRLKTQTIGALMEMNSSAIAVDYEISIPYTLPPDGKPQLVPLKTDTLPAQFSYYSIPKMDKSVFLVADVTGWQRLSLLPGPANLFFRGSFTGQSQLMLNAATDTLKLSFGRDKKTLIERKMVQNYASRQLVGGRKAMNLGYEIQVNNTNRESITLDVKDQIPVSTSEEIKIDELRFEAPAGVSTRHDKESGELSWKLTLKPGETQKIRVAYRVVYPKDMELFGY